MKQGGPAGLAVLILVKDIALGSTHLEILLRKSSALLRKTCKYFLGFSKIRHYVPCVLISAISWIGILSGKVMSLHCSM